MAKWTQSRLAKFRATMAKKRNKKRATVNHIRVGLQYTPEASESKLTEVDFAPLVEQVWNRLTLAEKKSLLAKLEDE